MSEEVKAQILHAWNRYVVEHARRYRKNEVSSAQHDDTFRLFKEGIKGHGKLSKREKEELLSRIGAIPA